MNLPAATTSARRRRAAAGCGRLRRRRRRGRRPDDPRRASTRPARTRTCRFRSDHFRFTARRLPAVVGASPRSIDAERGRHDSVTGRRVGDFELRRRRALRVVAACSVPHDNLGSQLSARPVLVGLYHASRSAREIRRRRVLCRCAIGLSAEKSCQPAAVAAPAGRWVPRQLSENDILSLGYRS